MVQGLQTLQTASSILDCVLLCVGGMKAANSPAKLGSRPETRTIRDRGRRRRSRHAAPTGARASRRRAATELSAPTRASDGLGAARGIYFLVELLASIYVAIARRLWPQAAMASVRRHP